MRGVIVRYIRNFENHLYLTTARKSRKAKLITRSDAVCFLEPSSKAKAAS